MSDMLSFEINGNSMFPTFNDGDSICIEKINANHKVDIDDIVVFMHPLKKNCKLIKRVTQIKGDSKFFVEGDNEDILSTDDSHNFGCIRRGDLIGIKKNDV